MRPRITSTLLLILSLVAISSCATSSVEGGGYPSHDIRMITPFAAGGNTDTISRTVASCLSDELGQNVVVENVPGAGGALGTRQVANAAPDGYTISMNSVSPSVLAPLTIDDAGYVFEDLEPLGIAYSTPVILYVDQDSQHETLESFAKAAKDDPRGLTVAVPGASTLQDLVAQQLSTNYDVPIQIIPVDSNAEIIRGVTVGDYTAGLTAVSLDYLPRIESGEIRVLAASGDKVPSYLPKVQTFDELGYSNLLSSTVIDTPLMAPAGLPAEVRVVLTDTLEICLQDEATRAGIGSDFVPDAFEAPAEIQRRYTELSAAVKDALNG